jgi:hypothetical protein
MQTVSSEIYEFARRRMKTAVTSRAKSLIGDAGEQEKQ